MRRDDRLDALLSELVNNLVDGIESLGVVFSEGGLQVWNANSKLAALYAASSRLLVDPDTNNLCPVLGEVGDVGILILVGHSGEEIVVGTHEGLRSCSCFILAKRCSRYAERESAEDCED